MRVKTTTALAAAVLALLAPGAGVAARAVPTTAADDEPASMAISLVGPVVQEEAVKFHVTGYAPGPWTSDADDDVVRLGFVPARKSCPQDPLDLRMDDVGGGFWEDFYRGSFDFTYTTGKDTNLVQFPAGGFTACGYLYHVADDETVHMLTRVHTPFTVRTAHARIERFSAPKVKLRWLSHAYYYVGRPQVTLRINEEEAGRELAVGAALHGQRCDPYFPTEIAPPVFVQLRQGDRTYHVKPWVVSSRKHPKKAGKLCLSIRPAGRSGDTVEKTKTTTLHFK